MKELTDEEIARQDYVDNEIQRLIEALSPTKESIDWNIEMIGDVRDAIQDWIVDKLKLSSEQNFYPFIEE